jgi:hypothetical protein
MNCRILPAAFALLAPFSAMSQEVRNAGESINTEYHEAFSSITPDGLTMFISSDRPGGFGEVVEDVFWAIASYDIYVAHREMISSSWGPAANLGSLINTSGTEHSPMLSPDGHWLYFVSDRTDLENFGGLDLFASYRQDVTDDLGWEEPINLGESVNSIWAESCPFFVEPQDGDAGFLYFVQANSENPASLDFKVSELDRSTGAWSHAQTMDISTDVGDGHFDAEHGYIWGFDFEGGYGASDIWLLDSVSGSGTSQSGNLVNMGSPINTEFEDTMPSATADGSRLYFNSDRPGGLGGFDIYEAILN